MKIYMKFYCGFMGIFYCFLNLLSGDQYYITNPKVRVDFIKKVKEYNAFDKHVKSVDIYNWIENKIKKSPFFDSQKISNDRENRGQAIKSFNFSCTQKGDYERKTQLALDLLLNENLKIKDSEKVDIEYLLPKILNGLDFYLKGWGFENLKQLKEIIINACNANILFVPDFSGKKDFCSIQ